MRKNPLIFRQDEYEFLHRVYLSNPSKAKVYTDISKKKGIGLSKDEIMYVKKKFAEWKEHNPNELLWMGEGAE